MRTSFKNRKKAKYIVIGDERGDSFLINGQSRAYPIHLITRCNGSRQVVLGRTLQFFLRLGNGL